MNDIDQMICEKFEVDNTKIPIRIKADRGSLPEIFSQAGCKIGAEIGVGQGVFSRCLLKYLRGLEKLYGVDPWNGYGVPRGLHWTAERNYLRTLKRLQRFNGRVDILRMMSMDAVKMFPNGSLDFVYIDGLHDFDNAMMDIIMWSDKVRKEGIVSGHDFSGRHSTGVICAVDTYTKIHGIENWYVIDEDLSSWLWVKV